MMALELEESNAGKKLVTKLFTQVYPEDIAKYVNGVLDLPPMRELQGNLKYDTSLKIVAEVPTEKIYDLTEEATLSNVNDYLYKTFSNEMLKNMTQDEMIREYAKEFNLAVVKKNVVEHTGCLDTASTRYVIINPNDIKVNIENIFNE